MNIRDDVLQPVIEARDTYLAAYGAYLHATPGRDLTIKQGEMQAARRLYQAAACAVFDLMTEETSGSSQQ